jgi:hypothetical protein
MTAAGDSSCRRAARRRPGTRARASPATCDIADRTPFFTSCRVNRLASSSLRRSIDADSACAARGAPAVSAAARRRELLLAEKERAAERG